MVKKPVLGIIWLSLACLTACSSGGGTSSLSQGGVFNVRQGTCTVSNSPDCFTATVSCPGTADIGVSVLPTNPSGTPKGTIVLHAGSGGTVLYDESFNNTSFVQSFVAAGYRVVQLAWATDWEDTGTSPKSLKVAACRVSTLLNYVYNNIHGGASAQGGMCALGTSGGAGAMAYVLTEYDGGSYLDKVLLTSGPVFSDIEQGCMVPNAPPVTICPAGEFGCVGDPWQAAPQLPDSLSTWSGDPTCQGGTTTSAASNTAWKEMSIVDGLPDSSFSQPQTALTGYLCGNGLGPAQAQGGLYFQNFTSASQNAAFALYRVDGCLAAEDVIDGFISAGPNAGEDSGPAIVNDMLDPVAGCVKRH